MTETLHDQLEALTRSLDVPQAVSELITRELGADATAGGPGLGVGDQAPDFELPDANGRRVRLTAMLRRGPVIVSFYRGEWCPYCNLEIRSWADRLDDVVAAGGNFLAITPQRPSNALSLTERHALRFPVLSDLDQEAVRAYRLRYELPAALKQVYQDAFGLDLTMHNADGSWTLTVPATFVVDQQQRIRFAHANLDWRVRAEPANVLAALQSVRLA